MEAILIDRLSKFIKEIKSLSDQAHSLCNININNKNLDTAKIVKAKLSSLLSKFTSELHNYFNMCTNPDPDLISDYTTYQLQGEENLAELDAKLMIINEQPTTSTRGSDSSGYSKLPDLSLPEFSGDLLQWRSFWDQFTSNISRRNLNDVDKLLYLKSSLKGDAARLIDGFDTTNKNYQIAVDTLKARFGKDNEIIYAHHKALSKVKQAENIEDCRGTLDEISRHLRVLQSMKENTNTNQLQYLVMEKFPSEIIYEIKMRLGTHGTLSVENILQQLSTVISAKEEARRITQENTLSEKNEVSPYTVETLHVNEPMQRYKNDYLKTNNSNARDHRRKNWNGNNSVPSGDTRQNNRPLKRKFYSTEERNGMFYVDKRKKWSCIFCGGSHNNADCDKVKTIEERKTKLKNRCFCCFREGHFILNCNNKKKCPFCSKHGLHNRALCPNKFQTKKKESTSVMFVTRKGSTILQTAVTSVKGCNTFKSCRILLDSGSQRSYVTHEFAEALNLQAEEHNNLAIFTFGSQNPREIDSPLVKLEIVMRDKSIRTFYANVVPSISQGVPHPDRDLLSRNKQLKHQLADDGSLSDRIDILLGNDYYFTVMSTKKICIRDDLYLIESEFGWIMSGRVSTKPVEQLSVLTYFQSSCEVGLIPPDLPLENENMKLLWDLESIGITDSPKTTAEDEAVHHFNETVEFREGRYQVKWPWTKYPPELPNNYGLAIGRLSSLLRRSDSQTIDTYNEILNGQVEAKVIEVVEPLLFSRAAHPIHYLPHHMVHQKGKKGRIVYDASAKIKGEKSLNECLYRGPTMIQDLTGLILHFRANKVALTADIEKAFLQVGLQTEDRDVTRFLWVKDLKRKATDDNIIQYRFCRVPFGVISSPFILNATIKHHLSKAENENVRKLANHIYVDNVVTGTNSIEEALEVYRNSKEAFQQISMNLRDWSSNSEEVMQHIPDTCPDKVVKILGLDWHLEEDTLQIRTSVSSNANTKRGILKSVASIYDPCGFAVPTLLSAKLLLQELWKMKIKWDAPLPSDIVDEWTEIKQSLNDVKNISLARHYMKHSQNKDCEIHCFTDSSTRAYAAVVYIVSDGGVSFVIGKSRLVPIKDQEHLKIPRLELLGVLIGSRLVQYVLKFTDLNVNKQVLWTDSQIVIDWCNSNKLLTPFVTRRVEEITRNKKLTIRYVPSELNPADVATRPTSSPEEREKWLAGPNFLLLGPHAWPTRITTINIDNTLLVGEVLSSSNELETEQPKPMKDVPHSPNTILEDTQDTSLEDTQDTTLEEIKKIQAEHFKDEVNNQTTSLSRNLGLFKDVDGILRCKGRFKYANWSFDKRYPIIIPKVCDFTAKVVKETHERNYHVGASHTLSIIRENYCIPQGKRVVGKILNKCSRCKKYNGGPFKLPPTPALPHERVNFSKPFTFTGIDYLGPVLVKTDTGTSKRWICLFTCLAVRAIHLEVVGDLSAEEGLLALRRMCSTRGFPTLITSDNASTFKLIAEIVSKPYCVKRKMKWRFIPELAPWFGGFYERLVGLVKQCMRKTLQKHLLKDSQLSTIIKEIEGILNTRPLTSVDAEPEHILKPSDFLQLGGCLTSETSDIEMPIQGTSTSTKTSLLTSWRKTRVLLREFEQMFQNRYLPSLRERYSHSYKQPRVTSKLTPQEGQIVQIKGDKNREGWKVGKIISLIKGSDGLVRVAQVKVGNTIFTRSIAHLYPLEVEDDDQFDPVSQESRENSANQQLPSDTSEQSVSRPDVMTIDADKTQEGALTDSETASRAVESMDATDETMDVTDEIVDVTDNRADIVSDDGDDVQNDPRERMLIDKDLMTKDDEPVEGQSERKRPRRLAAARAIKKIGEWTRNLMTMLL